MFWIALMCSLMHASHVTGQSRMFNATGAYPGEFPFMVAVRNGKIFCAGTIVNKYYILTAAHCVCIKSLLFTADVINIQYGFLVTETDENSIPVDRILCHEDYRPYQHHTNDVAVLKLASPIPEQYLFTTNLEPSNFSTDGDQYGTIVGWRWSDHKSDVPKLMAKITVIILNNTLCMKVVQEVRPAICVGVDENAINSAPRHAGGPLLVGDIQVGIVSACTPFMCKFIDSEYPLLRIVTRVSNVRNWIIQNTSDDLK